jgi:hypothetical protein
VSRRTAPLLAVVLSVVAGSLGGCVSLPDSGPVRSVTVTDTGDGDTLVDYTPPGPGRSGGRDQLVAGFLTAMTATPLSTRVAREFLAPSARRDWDPERGTVSYGSQQVVRRPDGVMRLELRDVVELDGRGSWLGDPTSGRGHDYRLRLVRRAGQWRISNPPDRLLVPRTHFASQYHQFQLYFFDESARVLVPEPVFVPRGRQAPTLLMAALLKGPEPALRDVVTTFLPAGTRLDGPSVPVSRSGTAVVPLGRAVLHLDTARRRRLFAQVAWTLGQLPGVERIEITVDGRPVAPGGRRTVLGVDEWSEFDPAVVWAATDPYGLRNGRVVTLHSGKEEQVSGPLGGVSLGLRSVAVDLLAQRIAGVRSDGRQVVESDRDGVPGRTPTNADVRTLYVGTDVLRPTYDLYGQLWIVDRTSTGAQLLVIGTGSSTKTVFAPGLTGRRVGRFVLSRDGTRLVTEVRTAGRDELFVARVRRDEKGRVLGVGAARRLAIDAPGGRIQDLAWRGPAALAVLVRPTATTSRLLAVELDGSSEPEQDLDVDLFAGRAVHLVSSAGRAPLLVGGADGRFFGLSQGAHWKRVQIKAGLRALTYPG